MTTMPAEQWCQTMTSMSSPDVAPDWHPAVLPARFTDVMRLGCAFTRAQWQQMAHQVARSDVWQATDASGRPALIGGFYAVAPTVHACWILARPDLKGNRRAVAQVFRVVAEALPVIAPPGRLFMAVRHGHKPGLSMARIFGFEPSESILDGHHVLVRETILG